MGRKRYYTKEQPINTISQAKDPFIRKITYVIFVQIVALSIMGGIYWQKNRMHSNIITRTPIPIPQTTSGQILGVVESPPTPTPTQIIIQTITVEPTQTSSPTPTSRYNKKSYIIALFGDSMIDTMGTKFEDLSGKLKKKFPGVQFNLFNYGIGAQNAEEAIARFTDQYTYKDRYYCPINELHPDVLIIGSFAYNPFVPYNRDRHWLALASLLDEAKKTTDNMYLLAEIAPIKNFGAGPSGVWFSEEEKKIQFAHIIEQLENAVGLSKSMDIPLIDAFIPSQINSDKEGKKTYVSEKDGIHPSEEGHAFIADKIAEIIQLDKLGKKP